MTEMVGAIDAIMAELKPEELYLPFPSLHQDHIAVYEAGMRSCRLSMSLDHWVPPSVLVYDIAVYDVNLYPIRPALECLRGPDRGSGRPQGGGLRRLRSQRSPAVPPDEQRAGDRRRPRSHAQLDFAEQYALVRQVRR